MNKKKKRQHGKIILFATCLAYLTTNSILNLNCCSYDTIPLTNTARDTPHTNDLETKYSILCCLVRNIR